VLLKELGKDLWSGRELAWRLFVRDFKAQYSQTMLGYVWAFLPPLFASLTFVFLQSQGIIKIEGLGIPYAAFAMIGTMLWQTFVESIQSPLQAISSAKPMLAKINFPRESILVAGMYMVLTSTAIRLLLIFGVMLVWGIMPGWSLVLLPFFLFGLMLCGFAVGMAIVPIGGLYGDVARSIPIFAQFWMLLTPVIYPARTGGWAGWLTQWNPVSPLIASARASLTNQPLEQMGLAIGYTILFGLISLMGLIGFRLIMPHLIARMGG
jgi:lipopolysaccharide transport system permease protein